jgi:predicted ATPase/class 3 adenylate cyclase
MADLPSGTVTFLFTDIEGSTVLWERDRLAMAVAVNRHLDLLRTATESQGGVLFKVVGDAAQAAFATAEAALLAAIAAQRTMLVEPWPAEVAGLRARMALHTGEAHPETGDYLAPSLNRLSRLLAVGHGGQVLLSQAAQQLVRGALPTGTELLDLGEHRLRDLLEPERVFQLRHPALPTAFPALRTLEHHPNNLPLQPTPFLGRGREVTAVAALLLRPTVRCVTLTGPGGTGKTRLALQVAADLLDDFRDGVFFIPLAPLADPGLVLSAIGAALAIRDEGERPLSERLRDALATKHLLLVVDNFEHLTEAAPALGELLGTAPGLTVLATSRMPLRLRAEHEYPVPPLGLPNRTPPPPLEQLTHYDAVRLFIERAQAVRPDFTVDNGNAPAVAEICWQLDGLPLAIELAAARVRMLPPQAMLARLEKRLPLLIGGARDAPARQQTLRATIDWSHDLLGTDEQILFRRLAVFAGGATFEAAEVVANPDGTLDVFGGLERLVEQNLLRQETGPLGTPRVTMLETVREFGFEHLALANEVDELRRRHAEYFLQLTSDQPYAMQILQQPQTVARVAAEYHNVRLALTWFDERGEDDALLRLGVALYGLWIARGLLGEGLRWLERALERSRQTRSVVRVHALNGAGNLALFQGDDARAEAHLAESLVLAREVGDVYLLGETLAHAGLLSYRRGEFARAEELLNEANRLLHGRGDGLWEGAPSLLLGDTALAQEQFESAARWYGESLDVLAGTGYDWILSDARAGLAAVSYCTGDLVLATTQYVQTLERAQEMGFPMLVVSALLGLAGIVAESGRPEHGARLLGAAEALANSLEATMFRRDDPVRERVLRALEPLGQERLAAAREAGRVLSLDQAVAEAKSLIAVVSDHQHTRN